jgi:hypothetical protein
LPYGEDTLKVNIIGDASKLKGALDQSRIGVAKFAEKVGSIGKTMAVVGLAVTAVSVGLIKMASDAEETASKFSVVFQDVSDAATESAKNLAENFGLSSVAAKQLLGDTGDLLTGFGFSGAAALDLSSKVNELAVDLASFTNYSGGAEGASKALTKALLGERESVKSLGISIMEVDVQAKILELTQQGLTFETERQAKAIATLTLMQEQSKNAIGDFARTSESFANQMRILKARVSDLGVALGEKLLPMATAMINKAVIIVEKMTAWVKAHPKLVEWITKLGFTLGIIAAIGGPILMAAAAFAKVKTVVDSVTFALKLLNIRMGATATISTGTLIPSLAGIGGKFAWLGAAAGPIAIVGIAVGGLYAAWKTNLFGMRDITIEAFNNIKGNFTELEDSLAGGGSAAGAFFDEVNEAIEPTDTFAKSNETLADNLDEVAKKAKEASEQIKIYAEDVAENYIALSIAATESWEAFYEFWEAEAKRTAGAVEETVKKVASTMYKILDEAGNVIGLTNIQQISPGENLVPMTQPGTSTINGQPITTPSGGVTSLTPFQPLAPGGNTTDFLKGGVTVNVTVQGDGNATEIKKAVEQALDESARQYNRRGFEMVPGIG